MNAIERVALGGEYDLELRGSTVLWKSSEDQPILHRLLQVWYADYKGCVWLIHCTAVLFQ